MGAVAICVGEVIAGCLFIYVLARRWVSRQELYRTPRDRQPEIRRRILRTTLTVCWTAVVVGAVTGLLINLG